MTIQPQNNNLNYLIDRTFTNVNRLFVLSFARNNAGDNRGSFSHYYVPNIEIKDFNVLIDGKSFFELPSLGSLAIPLAKNVLAPLGITAAASAIDTGIKKTTTWFWGYNISNFK